MRDIPNGLLMFGLTHLHTEGERERDPLAPYGQRAHLFEAEKGVCPPSLGQSCCPPDPPSFPQGGYDNCPGANAWATKGASGF